MIVLFNPKSGQFYHRLPLSLLALGAKIEGRYDYQIVDANVTPNSIEAIDAALGPEPLALAITVMPGPQLAMAVAVSHWFHEHRPNLPIIWGGSFPTLYPDVCLGSDAVDYVARGPGEETFSELLALLAANRPLDDVAGLSLRIGGQVRHNHERPIPDVESLPRYPYHRVVVERHRSRTYLGKHTLNHVTSYGCPFRCNFCSIAAYHQGRWVGQSASRIVGDVRALVEQHGADSVEFHDDNFFIAEGRLRDVANGIRPLGIGWWCEGRLDTLMHYRSATWKALEQSGCRMVFMGAESGSDQTLAQMNKGGTQSASLILETARRFCEYDIIPEFSFVLGNPPDPEADLCHGIEFIRQLKQVNPRAEIILYLYTPVPAAGPFETALAGGFSYPQTPEAWIERSWFDYALRRNPRTPWLRKGYREKLADFEAVLNARHPTASDTKLRPWSRALLRTAGWLRYELGLYGYPIELRALQRLLRYRQPEREGL